MMVLNEISEALRSLYSYRQRAAIALIGIVVGVGSVIAMISVGKIAQDEVYRQFMDIGTDIITIRNEPSGVAQGNKPNFNHQLKELLDIPLFCSSVSSVAPSVSPRWQAGYSGKKIDSAVVLGVTQSFSDLNKLSVKNGRFLSELDQMGRFCVIGDGVYQKMAGLGAKNAVGERMKIGDNIFTVIGVLAPVKTGFIRDFDANMAVYVHITSALRMSGNVEPATTMARVKPGVENSAAKEQVESYFYNNTKVKQLKVTSPEEMVAHMEKQMQLFTLLLGAIGSIALIMGGVGVMNVMISAVSERRREIGIRRALGAKRKDIRDQFIIESLVLSLAGGLLGVFLGTGASFLISYIAKWQFSISYIAIIGGAGVSSAVGIFFGLYPAYQASRLDPIIALRSE